MSASFNRNNKFRKRSRNCKKVLTNSWKNLFQNDRILTSDGKIKKKTLKRKVNKLVKKIGNFFQNNPYDFWLFSNELKNKRPSKLFIILKLDKIR